MLAQIVTTALVMAYALIGFAVLHTPDAGAQQPRLLARRHLRRRRRVRLAAGRRWSRSASRTPCSALRQRYLRGKAAAVARGLRLRSNHFNPNT